MPSHHALHYTEFPSRDLAVTQAFFTAVFGWTFTSYGEDYSAFVTGDREGGIYKSDCSFESKSGSPLLVFYSTDLVASQREIEAAGAQISEPIFRFPGGARFHFIAPDSGEFAVWSDTLQDENETV